MIFRDQNRIEKIENITYNKYARKSNYDSSSFANGKSEMAITKEEKKPLIQKDHSTSETVGLGRPYVCRAGEHLIRNILIGNLTGKRDETGRKTSPSQWSDGTKKRITDTEESRETDDAMDRNGRRIFGRNV